MVYELWHKNINVLTVEYEPETNKFGKILSVHNEKHIPVGIQNIPSHNLSQGLQFWWQSRLIPKNRSGFKINNPDIDFLLTGSNGFNLSDQYWIKDEKSNMTDKAGIEKAFMQMNMLDYITANTDRHYGNFGFVRNAETLEWIGVAPNFDTGNAMFYEYPTSDLRRSTSLMENVISRSFSTNQREQAEKFSDKIALLDVDLKKLDGIKDYYEDLLSRNPKEDAERIHLLSNLLLKRIENFKEIIYSKNSVSKEFINIISSDTSDLQVIDKINTARKQIYKTDKDKGILIDKYLQNIKTKTIEEFESKFQKEMNKAISKQKKLGKNNKSISDDDGMSIGE